MMPNSEDKHLVYIPVLEPGCRRSVSSSMKYNPIERRLVSDDNPCVDIQIDSSLLNPFLNPALCFMEVFIFLEALESMC